MDTIPGNHHPSALAAMLINRKCMCERPNASLMHFISGIPVTITIRCSLADDRL